MRYNHHVCYYSNINANFIDSRWIHCDTHTHTHSHTGTTRNLERHLVTCCECVTHTHLKIVPALTGSHTSTILFKTLTASNIPFSDEQKVFKNMAIFSRFVSKMTNTRKQTAKWTRKHVPISVSISSDLIQTLFFFCDANSHHLVFFSRRFGYPEKNSVEIEICWCWENNRDKIVPYAGLYLYHQLWETRHIYRIPANANIHLVDFQEHLECCFNLLLF